MHNQRITEQTNGTGPVIHSRAYQLLLTEIKYQSLQWHIYKYHTHPGEYNSKLKLILFSRLLPEKSNVTTLYLQPSNGMGIANMFETVKDSDYGPDKLSTELIKIFINFIANTCFASWVHYVTPMQYTYSRGK